MLDQLQARAWPGNVRELRNVVERMVILSGARITAADVPGNALDGAGGTKPKPATVASEQSLIAGFVIPLAPDEKLTLRELRDRAEAEYVRAILKQQDWNISRAAGVLGIERTNLHKKMRQLGIHRAGVAEPD